MAFTLLGSLVLIVSCSAPKPEYTVQKWCIYSSDMVSAFNEAEPRASEGWLKAPGLYSVFDVVKVTGGVSREVADIMSGHLYSVAEGLVTESIQTEYYVGLSSVHSYWDGLLDASHDYETRPTWYVDLAAEDLTWTPEHIQWSFVYTDFTQDAPHRRQTFLHLNPHTGHEISFQDFIVPGEAHANLLDKIWKTTLSTVTAKNPEYVTADGILMGDFGPVGGAGLVNSYNWQIGATGLKLVFNPGYIAPASAGGFEVTIPATELKGLLKGY